VIGLLGGHAHPVQVKGFRHGFEAPRGVQRQVDSL
jgi:hypothetical protein